MDIKSRTRDATSANNNSLKETFLLRKPRPPKPIPDFQLQESRKNSTGTIIYKDVPPYMEQPSTPKSVKARNQLSQALPELKDLYRTHMEDLSRKDPKFVINAVYPRGPKFFPPGRVFHADPVTSMTAWDFLPDEIHLADLASNFTFNDLQIPVLLEAAPRFPIQGTVSRLNYLKLTGWFAKNVPTQENLNMLDLEVDHAALPGRVPKGQILVGEFE